MRTHGTRAWLLIMVMTTGCAAPQWDGTIRQWGSIREVLRDQRTEGRVLLSEAVASPHAFGIGAMESLGGEVLIDDGQVWIGRAEGSTNQSTRNGTPANESATLLAIAYVPSWIELDLASE